MSLTLKEVEQIGQLARLKLTPDEIERFRAQLSAILDYAERLQALDTSQVAPTAQVTGLEGVTREDEPRPGLDHDDALANVPDSDEGYVVVPTVLDDN